MQTRWSSLCCLAAMLLLLAACSSTTVVARDERAPTDDAAPTVEPDDVAGTDVTADNSEDEDEDELSVDSDEPAPADGEPDDDSEEPPELEVTEGFGLGGAEQIAGLLTDCEAGTDMACDILFQLSEIGSAEETAALSCGGRSDTELLFCTPEIDAADGQLVFDAGSAGLTQIVDDCVDGGDMTACDFLYFRSAIDSEFEEIGATCGGRVDVAVPDCRTFLTE